MNPLQAPRRHDDLLNYRLKRLLTLGGAPAIRLCEGGYGITRLEWRLLAALVESGPMSSSELARHAHVDPGRVSLRLRRLVAKALVRRDPGGPGRTRAAIAATADGHVLYQSLWPQLAEINSRLAAALDDAEAEMLDRCLAKLTACAQRIHDAGGGVDVKSDRRHGGSRRFWSEEIE